MSGAESRVSAPETSQPINFLLISKWLRPCRHTYEFQLLGKVWNYQKQKAFVNVICSKFEGTRNSYGFELMIAEIGVKTLR